MISMSYTAPPQAISPEEAKFSKNGLSHWILKLMAKRRGYHKTPQDILQVDHDS